MKKILCALFLVIAGIIGLGNGALAAGNAEISIKGEAFQEGTSTWNVTCEIDGDTKVTNGKIRITYDSSQLKLTSSKAGDLLAGALTDINDPQSGNKPEGEVLFVFASASEMDAKGTLLELEFQVQSQVKNNDEVTVSVQTEELKNNSDTVSASDSALKVTVGGSAQNENSGSAEQPNDTSDNSDTNAETPNDGDAGIESTETQGGGTSVNSADTGTGSGQSSSSNSVNPVKTGDDTNVLLPAAVAIIALIVLIGGFFWKKKKK